MTLHTESTPEDVRSFVEDALAMPGGPRRNEHLVEAYRFLEARTPDEAWNDIRCLVLSEGFSIRGTVKRPGPPHGKGCRCD